MVTLEKAGHNILVNACALVFIIHIYQKITTKNLIEQVVNCEYPISVLF